MGRGERHHRRQMCIRDRQSQTSAELVATLLDAAGTVLETKKTGIGGAISGESFQTENVTFSRLGTRVVVRAAVPGDDILTFDGLAVGLGDFTANGTNFTYTLQNDSGATSTLVTAVSVSYTHLDVYKRQLQALQRRYPCLHGIGLHAAPQRRR